MSRASTAEQATTPATIAEATVEVERLARQEVERYALLREKKQELLAAQNAQDFKRAAVIREEVEYLQNPDTGRPERVAAILRMYALKADALESEAARLNAQVADRKVKANALLAQLQDMENVKLHEKYLSDRTATHSMATEASQLELDARQLRSFVRQGQVKKNGTVFGYSGEELVEALMHMPDVLGPSIASIYEHVEKRRMMRGNGQRMGMTFYGSRIDELEWQGLVFPEDRKLPR